MFSFLYYIHSILMKILIKENNILIILWFDALRLSFDRLRIPRMIPRVVEGLTIGFTRRTTPGDSDGISGESEGLPQG